MTTGNYNVKAFRKALGSFATGVTIVTTCDADGNDVGVTANSFNSVSLDPPLVLWSLSKKARSISAFTNAEHFAVHVLSADQESLSDRFARTGSRKFEGLQTSRGPGGIPLLEGCAARFQCATTYHYEGGDHVIIVGRVLDFDHTEAVPLVFHGGRYALASRKDPGVGRGGRRDGDEEGFIEELLPYQISRAHHQIMARMRALIRPMGLALDEYFVLATLVVTDGAELARLRRLFDSTGITVDETLLERLADRGLVNARAAHYFLTAQGRDLVVHGLAAAKAVESDAIEGLDYGEQAMLKSLLQRVIDATGRTEQEIWTPPPDGWD
jgi:3-hydroxy-9,10-secoandrosta-1,3,5(10)-triene-9,17-dione monooxygenase reductase component